MNPTLTLTLTLAYEITTVTTTARVAKISFASGVESRKKIEINTAPKEWTIKTILDSATAANIDTFLESASGYIPFYWSPGHPAFPSTGLFICDNWQIEYLSESVCNFTATFKQWFGFPPDSANLLILNDTGFFLLDSGDTLAVGGTSDVGSVSFLTDSGDIFTLDSGETLMTS